MKTLLVFVGESVGEREDEVILDVTLRSFWAPRERRV